MGGGETGCAAGLRLVECPGFIHLMAAILHVIPGTGEPFDLEIANTATIGRTSENVLAFPASAHVSRQHAVVRCHDGTHYQITDLGSRNGTFVNGQQVVLPTPLPDGSRIRIADNEIVFRPVEETAAEHETEVTIAMTMEQAANRMLTAAILVCDVRGFSTFSEQLPPTKVAHFIGQWFRQAGDLIHQTGGVVDKFIGDAVLAYWAEFPGQPDVCESALTSAVNMLGQAERLAWPELDAPMQVGIALHYGRVTSGNIGLVAQRDATIMGDTVNTAFRLESVMKELGQAILCSEAFVEPFSDRSSFVDLGEKRLKGKSQLVRVFGRR